MVDSVDWMDWMDWMDTVDGRRARAYAGGFPSSHWCPVRL